MNTNTTSIVLVSPTPATVSTSWTRERMWALLETRSDAVCRAVSVLYSFQTASEQASGATSARNGAGFNSRDAAFGSSLARQLEERGFLTPKQVAAARRMLRKYSGQLAAYANWRKNNPEC